MDQYVQCMDEIVRRCDVQCMDEIVRRCDFIREFFEVSKGKFPEPVVAETIGLQTRKILELIAKASLVAHRSTWEEASLLFSGDWNANKVLHHLEKVNPWFYPQPVRESQVHGTGPVRATWEEVPTDKYFTKDKFIKAYDAIGKMMHARAPNEQLDYREFLEKAHQWYSQIHRLLEMHTIQLLRADTFCLVQMNVGGKPTWTYWASVPD